MIKYSWKSKYTLFSCIFFLVLWEVVAIILNNDIYLPRIECILKELLNLVKDKNKFL